MKKLGLILMVFMLTSCSEEEAAPVAAASSSSASVASDSSMSVYPSKSGYTEGDTGHQYWFFDGANQNAVMGDYNSRWRTVLVSFPLSALNGKDIQSVNFYIFRETSNDLPAAGFQPQTDMGDLILEKLQENSNTLVPGMGRSDIWFYGSNYSVPYVVGTLANTNAAYNLSNAGFSTNVTSAVTESISNSDSYVVFRVRHFNNTAAGSHRVDFYLKHAENHSYKPYLEVIYR